MNVTVSILCPSSSMMRSNELSDHDMVPMKSCINPAYEFISFCMHNEYRYQSRLGQVRGSVSARSSGLKIVLPSQRFVFSIIQVTFRPGNYTKVRCQWAYRSRIEKDKRSW